jgi:hypothetical protein
LFLLPATGNYGAVPARETVEKNRDRIIPEFIEIFISRIPQNSHMAIYSDEKRPILAKLIKYALFANVVLFILLVLLWVLMAGLSAGITHTGINATILLGLNVAAFLIYEQLFRPEDDGWRRIAEILGSLQIVCSCVAVLVVLGAIALAVVPGLAGTPEAQGTHPAAAGALSGALPADTQVNAAPTNCYRTSTGCMPIAPDPTAPPRGATTYADDPIIGSFIFDKAQFSYKIDYNSKAGNYEYNYKSVPLDHSPDIRWTFRDDGVILFYDNNKGTLLRTATWTKATSSKGLPEYRIKRGNTEYRGSFVTDEIFQINSPDFWNMTKIG